MMCTKIYNKIPQAIKSIAKPKSFETALNNYLLDKSYYSLKEFFEDTFPTK